MPVRIEIVNAALDAHYKAPVGEKMRAAIDAIYPAIRAEVLKEAAPLVCRHCAEGLPLVNDARWHEISPDHVAECKARAILALAQDQSRPNLAGFSVKINPHMPTDEVHIKAGNALVRFKVNVEDPDPC